MRSSVQKQKPNVMIAKNYYINDDSTCECEPDCIDLQWHEHRKVTVLISSFFLA